MKKLSAKFTKRSIPMFLLLGMVVCLAIAGIVRWGSQRTAVNRVAEFIGEPPEAGTEEDPDARAKWFMEQRMYPFDSIPASARRRAFEEVLARGKGLGPKAAGTTWQSIGPLPTTSAFPNNGGFTSGRINAIAVSPANAQVLLVGSATGGIWRSADGGTTFAPVSDTQADLAVASIAFAVNDPNTVYAAMGDKDNGYFGTGILKSSDAGQTWARVNNNTFPDRGNCTAVRVDPTDANRVFVSQYTSNNAGTGDVSAAGVYVSTDGGVNWVQRISGLATDLAIHPTNPQIIYAAMMREDSGGLPGLYRSTNGGTSFARVYDSLYPTATAEFRVAVTPANPNRVYVYYGSSGTSPAESHLEMSDDSGATWTTRPAVPNVNAGGIDTGQFSYNIYLAASPTDANTVYVGARDIFTSADSGVTFTDISNAWTPPWTGSNYTPNNQKFHSDQQSFASQPGSGTTFYCGNDGGLWKTTDGGATFATLNTTLGLTQFVGIAVNPVDSTKSYGGTQDNGTQRRTGGSGWNEFSGGDGGKAVINPLDPSMVFHSYVNGSITRSVDHAATFSGQIAEATSFGEPANGGRIAFYPPIVGNGVDAKLYVGTYRLFICSNCEDTSKSVGGTPPTWTAPGGTFDQTTGGDDILSAIAVAKSNNQVIYTGSRNGKAMVSTNGGANWTDITTGLPNRSIASIKVSPTDPTLVYLTVSGYGSSHVFKSTNSGTNWTDINNNLPNIPTSAFLIDPLTPTTLYAGTDIGVFRSTDGGTSWAPFNNGLPPVPVMEFTSQAGGLIQIGTYGRGAFELPATKRNTSADYDGDGKTDVSVFRPSDNSWYLNRSTAGFTGYQFGAAGDKLAPADFTGDGKTDVAVWRPSDGVWYILRSEDNSFYAVSFGTNGDLPVPGDYDGDGKADQAVFRPSSGTWFLQRSTAGFSAAQFGASGDVPTAGDFDGDGKADIAVFRPTDGVWYRLNSSNGSFTAIQFGANGDLVAPADFTGDGKTDLAVFRPPSGTWYVLRSEDLSFYGVQFGTNGDLPAPGDYDGDGKADPTVFRPTDGNWYQLRSTSGFGAIHFGANGDLPTPNSF